MKNKPYDILDLGRKSLDELRQIAADMNCDERLCIHKQQTIYTILEAQEKKMMDELKKSN